MQKKTENILRWILLPISTPILFVLNYWVFYIIGKWSFSFVVTWEIKQGDVIDSIILILSTIGAYLSTLYYTTKIAPSNKLNVLKVISLLFLIIEIIIITISIINWKFEYITSIISGIIIITISTIILIKNVMLKLE